MAAMDPERMLMMLSGDLSALVKRLEALEAAKLAEKLGELGEKVSAVNALLEQMLAEEPEPEPEGLNPAVVWDWETLTSEEAAEAWEILVTWCREVLYPIYARPHWHPCWYRHQSLVEELTWLSAYWHWSYKLKGAPPTRSADWHSRCWPHVRTQLGLRFERCYVPTGPKQPADTSGREGAPEMSAEQTAQLAAMTEASRRRAVAAGARSGQPAQVPPEEEIRPTPLHALRKGHENDFADDEDLSNFIAADLAQRRLREAEDAALEDSTDD